MTDETRRTCIDCGKEQDIEQFFLCRNNKTRRSYRRRVCRTCVLAQLREAYRSQKELGLGRFASRVEREYTMRNNLYDPKSQGIPVYNPTWSALEGRTNG